MITAFDSLYAGHVDMENVGYGGTPVNDRWFSDDHLATVFDKMTAMALLMERSGYNTLWMAEHHFQREGYECLPNVLLSSLHPCPPDQEVAVGMRLQHRSHVAPASSGRGLCHR